MNLFRNRLILGFLFRFVTEAIKLVYKIIDTFNLQIALLVFLIGFIVFVIAGVEASGAIFTVFIVAMFASILLAVFGTVRNLLGLDKKPKKKRGAQIVDSQQVVIEEQPKTYVASNIPQARQEQVEGQYQAQQPVYFRTKQNPDYVFAEFSDRYELYKISSGQLVKIRTDYKSN